MPLRTLWAVVIGEKVYIGGGGILVKEVRGSGEGVVGGSTGIEEEKGAQCPILEYSMTGEGPHWRTIVTPIVFLAMGTVDNKLIIGGGVVPAANLSDQVSVLDRDNKTWTKPFPAMTTARLFSLAIGYKRWLVVAGGSVLSDDESMLWKCWTPAPNSGTRHHHYQVLHFNHHLSSFKTHSTPLMSLLKRSHLQSKSSFLL